MSTKPLIVGIAGIASNVGKTTLMCELLRLFPGWEAIKITRGHYRSCGKDAETCCVSHLLSDEPVVYSDRSETLIPGKDTGRYWDAGASNVHWVIVTKDQVELGIKKALDRVRAPGVFVEGTSFIDFVDVDNVLMVAHSDIDSIKPSAKRVMQKVSAIYVSSDGRDSIEHTRSEFDSWLEKPGRREVIGDLPVFTRFDLSEIVRVILGKNCSTVGGSRLLVR